MMIRSSTAGGALAKDIPLRAPRAHRSGDASFNSRAPRAHRRRSRWRRHSAGATAAGDFRKPQAGTDDDHLWLSPLLGTKGCILYGVMNGSAEHRCPGVPPSVPPHPKVPMSVNMRNMMRLLLMSPTLPEKEQALARTATDNYVCEGFLVSRAGTPMRQISLREERRIAYDPVEHRGGRTGKGHTAASTEGAPQRRDPSPKDRPHDARVLTGLIPLLLRSPLHAERQGRTSR
jgi:hypothetical protein